MQTQILTSVISLNVNELNTPIKRQRLATWIKKKKKTKAKNHDQTLCYLQETYFDSKTQTGESKRMGKNIHTMQAVTQKRA